MTQINKFRDNSQTQAVIVTFTDGSEGTFYGPLQFPDKVLKDDTIKIADVAVSDPIPMANGVKWMLSSPEDGLSHDVA